jgi:hypothetical protein
MGDKSEIAPSSISGLLLRTSSRRVVYLSVILLSFFQLGRIGVLCLSNSYSHSEWVAVVAGGDLSSLMSSVLAR